MSKETYTEQMLKDIAEKQVITNGKLDTLSRRITDDQDGDTYRYNTILRVLLHLEEKLNAVQRKQDDERVYLNSGGGGNGAMGNALSLGKVTYVTSSPAIEEMRDAINKLREDLLKPRAPGTFGIAYPLITERVPKIVRCSDPKCPLCNTSGIAPAPPPPEQGLSEIFAQFMAESYLTRTRVSYFADHGAYATALRNYRVEHYVESVMKYDIPAFLELLRKTPKECIL